MEFRNLGKSGLKVSLVGLGCNNFGMRIDAQRSREVVTRALDEGITLFDTADIYGNRGGSEQMLGGALGARRKDVIVATKFGMAMGEGPYQRGASRRYIMAAVEASLARLGTDYIDLYQLHAPDPETPQQETLETLDALVRSGKVRYVGCSNLPGWQLADAMWIAREHNLSSYISAQDHYNLLERRIERELIPAATRFGVGLLPYFPLASGFLTGKYRKDTPLPEDSRLAAMKARSAPMLSEHNFRVLAGLEALAAENGHSMLELAMSWLACQPLVGSVIAGATRAEQVSANVKAVNWKMAAAELSAIDKLTRR